MAQIPYYQRTDLMGFFCYGSHIIKIAAFKDDMGQGYQGGILIYGVVESLQIGGYIAVLGADANDFMFISQQTYTSLKDIQI